MRPLPVVLAVCVCVFACGVWAAEPVKAPPGAMQSIRYAELGFQVQVPRAAAKQSIPASGDVRLSELHISGDLVYIVKVNRTPPDTLASTAIEQSIQAMTKAAEGASARWEIDSKQGNLFKGLSKAMKPDELGEAEAEQVKRALRDRDLFGSLCMAPLDDESSPILTVGVIGPAGRQAEIENTAKFLAYNVKRVEKVAGPDTPPEPIAPPAAPTDRPGPRVRPVKTPPAPPGQSEPGEPPVVKPPQVHKPAPVKHDLKKGEIELLGTVESVDEKRGEIVMMVSEITMPRLKPIPLDPHRRKIVLYKTLLPGIEPGARIRVIGKNTGVGRPVSADVLELVEAAQPPNRSGI